MAANRDRVGQIALRDPAVRPVLPPESGNFFLSPVWSSRYATKRCVVRAARPDDNGHRCTPRSDSDAPRSECRRARPRSFPADARTRPAECHSSSTHPGTAPVKAVVRGMRDLAEIIRHRPARERIQHRGIRKIEEGGAVAEVMFKYMFQLVRERGLVGRQLYACAGLRKQIDRLETASRHLSVPVIRIRCRTIVFQQQDDQGCCNAEGKKRVMLRVLPLT